jgi:dihydrodipicolinate synthase/N-acetylneuraminate lyase
MGNFWKWLGVLALGAAGGSISAMTDQNAKLADYIKHAILGAAPTIVAIKTNLEKAVGIEPEAERARAAGAGD